MVVSATGLQATGQPAASQRSNSGKATKHFVLLAVERAACVMLSTTIHPAACTLSSDVNFGFCAGVVMHISIERCLLCGWAVMHWR